MSICDDFNHRWGIDGDFCVAVGPGYQDCLHTGLLYAILIGSKPRRLK